MRQRFKDWISLIEAGYDLAGSDQQWLEHLRDKADPLLGRGMWPTMMTYRYTPTRVDFELTATNGFERMQKWAAKSSLHTPPAVDLMYRSSIPVGSLSEVVFSRMPELRYEPRKVSLGVVTDALAVKAHCGSGRGILLWSAFMRYTRATAMEKKHWPRVISHLAAGLRLRSAAKNLSLDSLDHGENRVEAILDPGGKLLHVSEKIHSPDDARIPLRKAVRLIDNIRRGSDRNDPERTLPLWQGLVEGRWSLVDRFDSDGKRYVIAIKNDPVQTDPRGLSVGERQVAEFVGIGYGNKEISYMLGISPAAVSNSISRALFKLGLQRRVELASFFAPGGLRARLAEVMLAGEDLLIGAYPLSGAIKKISLTDSEQNVLAHLIAGSTNEYIALSRRTSSRTVANQIQSIYRKTNVRSRSELAAHLHGAYKAESAA